MNFLAHFHLAASEDDWLVGALLGDFVKGPLRGEWPPGWEAGIRLHRRIDAESDRLPGRRAMAAALPPELRRYAGILFDLYTDHWLSRHWPELAEQPLPRFADRVYAVLAREQAGFPTAAQRFSERLRQHDLLNRYHDWTVIDGALVRIGQQLRRPNPLATAMPALRARQRDLDTVCAADWAALRASIAATASRLSAGR